LFTEGLIGSFFYANRLIPRILIIQRNQSKKLIFPKIVPFGGIFDSEVHAVGEGAFGKGVLGYPKWHF
jgi:hypothetical protein